ncbi:MAG: hypothetical protein F9K32_13770 [Desulfobulbaceae bacterium]|nr:MAG: hypothetical protein F9K32_13770 [Desulfobulbaceae bacterium]
MRYFKSIFCGVILLTAGLARAADTVGSLTANGRTAEMTHALAWETDSTTEPGYLDVTILISDREIAEAVARDRDRLEVMARNGELAGLLVVLNPDARVMSAEPLHQAFTTMVSSALWIRWEPTAFDEKRVAGRFHSDGLRQEFGQKWKYDITFSAPIVLDPKGKTVK